MRVLITGGAGFIGSHFCDLLRAAGQAVTILDQAIPSRELREHRFVRGDVRSRKDVRAAMAGCDAVLHLAAAHADFGISPATYFSVNESGSAVVCDVMDECGVLDACFFSSVAVYGDGPEPHDEDAATRPTTPYGQSKLAAEAVFRRWSAQGGGRRALIIRPTVVFGPRNFANMYRLIRQIHGRLYFPIGRGTNVKSLTYVDNLVTATWALWQRQPRPAFEIFNYADKPDLTSREIAAAVFHALGRRPPRFWVPLPLARLLSLPFDWLIALTGKNLPVSSARIRKLARDQTRFEAAKVRAAGAGPAVSLPEGIKRTVEWFLREGRHRRGGGAADQPPVGYRSDRARVAEHA